MLICYTGTGYPLQYSWTSLVAQLGKNLPAMRETWVQSRDWDDALEENSMGCIAHGVGKTWARLRDVHFAFKRYDLNPG